MSKVFHCFRRLVHPRWAALAAIGVIAVACYGVTVRLLPPSRVAVGAPLRMEEQSLDFGTVWAQPRFQWQISLTNPGSSDVLVERVSTSCNCTIASDGAFIVPAGETVVRMLHFDLRPKTRRAAAISERGFSVRIVAGVAGAGEAVWTIMGRVKNPIRLSAAQIAFDDIDPSVERATPMPEQVLEYESIFPLRSVSVSAHPPEVISAIVDERSPTGGTITVQPSLSLMDGVFECELQIRLRREDGLTHEIFVPVAGTVVPDIYIEPAFLVVRPDSVCEATIRSRSSSELTVSAIDNDSEVINIVQSQHGGSSDVTLQIMAPTKPARSIVDVITFHVRDSGGRERNRDLRILTLGQEPDDVTTPARSQ